MYAQLDRVKSRLKQDGYLLWQCDGFEADDIIATAVEQIVTSGTDEVNPVIIASPDKDMFQLLCPGVTQYRTHNGTYIDAGGVKEKSGITPAQFVDFLALVGDKADNIKGADGVGEKTAAELLIKFGSLKAIFEHAEQDPVEETYWRTAAGKPGALRPKLVACKEQVQLARKLVALRVDAPIKLAEIFEERKVEDLVTDEVDAEFADDRISPPPPRTMYMPPPGDSVPTATEAIRAVFQDSTVVNGALALKPDVVPTAIAVKQPANEAQAMARTNIPFELGLEPQSLAQAQQLSAIVFNSRLYPKFTSEKAVLVAMVRGREMGLGALASLDVFHWMEKEGKLALHAHAIMAMVEDYKDCEYIEFRGGDATYAEYAFKNKKKPQPLVFRYTIEDAVRAGITTLELQPRTSREGEKDGRGNWHKRRPEMLRKTCGVQGGRIEFPRAALGLVSFEEMGVDHE